MDLLWGVIGYIYKLLMSALVPCIGSILAIPV